MRKSPCLAHIHSKWCIGGCKFVVASLCNFGVLKTFMCKSPMKPIIWLFFISNVHFVGLDLCFFFNLFFCEICVLKNKLRVLVNAQEEKLVFVTNFAMLLTFIHSLLWLLSFFHPHDFHVWLLCFVRGFHLNIFFLSSYFLMFMFCNIFLLCCLSTLISIQHCFISKSTCCFGSSKSSLYSRVRFFCVSSKNKITTMDMHFAPFLIFLFISLLFFVTFYFFGILFIIICFFLFIYRDLCKLG